jgi:transketolase
MHGPAYIRLGRYPVPDLFDGSYRFELGRANTLRQGRDLTLIACGHMLNVSLQAAELLSSRQVEATVLNMASIKPLDRDAVLWAMENTPLVVTIEEHSIIGGLGSAVAEVMAERVCGARLIRLGTQDVFGESGTADELLEKHGLTPTAIAARLRHEFGR